METAAKNWRSKFPLKSALGIGFSLGLLRLLLPGAIKVVANRNLKKNPLVGGSVGKVKIGFLKGRCEVEDVRLTPRTGAGRPTIHVRDAHVRINWSSLLRKRVVASAHINQPSVLVHAETSADRGNPRPRPRSSKESLPLEAWNVSFRSLFPFKLEKFSIHQGRVDVLNLPGKNGGDLKLDNIHLSVENIVNRDYLSPTARGFGVLDASAGEAGHLSATAEAYPLAKKPTFKSDLELTSFDLPELKETIRHYAGADVTRGTLNVFAEAAAENGELKGYVKPVIEHLRLESAQNGGTKMKGVLASVASILLKNRAADRVATKVQISGRVDDPEIGVSSAVKNSFKNAFGRALSNGFEPDVDFSPLRGTGTIGDRIEKKSSRWASWFGVLKESVSRWSGHKAPRLGAVLAYYTIFSLAPLLLLCIAIAGFAYGQEAVQGQIVDQFSGLIGPQSAEMLQSMIEAARKPASGVAATIIGVLALLLGASGVMAELKRGLNRIWDAEPPAGIKGLIRSRLVGISLVLGVGFLLLTSLVVSAGLAAFGKFLEGLLPVSEGLLYLLNIAVSFGVITCLFAILFKFLPDTKIAWDDVWVGAMFTTALFVVGKLLLGLYLGKGSVGSSYGAAGALLVLLLWVYYSAQILYLGAEFTRVYSTRYGSRKGQPLSVPSAAL